MLEVTAVSFIAAFLAWFGGLKKVKYPLLFPCLIISAFLSLRYNWTTDFRPYAKIFRQINIHEDWNYSSYIESLEIGWKLLNRLCKPLGYQAVITVVTFIEICSVGVFLTRYIPKKWQWLVFLFYMISPYDMLMQLNNMRQGVAVAVMLWAVPYILDRKLFKSFLIWIVAFCFHQASLIALPLLFAGYLNPKRWKWTVSIEVGLIILTLVGQVLIILLLNRLAGQMPMLRLDSYLEDYTEASIASGAGMLVKFVFFGYIAYRMSKMKDDRHLFIFSAIFLVSLMVNGIQVVAVFASRLGWFYAIMGLPAIMAYANNMKKSIFARAMLCVYFLFELYNLYIFYNYTFPDDFLKFQTIFTN